MANTLGKLKESNTPKVGKRLYTVVGDLHAKPGNLNTVEKLFELVEELGHPVIMLGDTFDTKELIRGKCLTTVLKCLKRSKLDWIFLIGNHDLFHLQSTEHSLETLKELKNVTIVDEPHIGDSGITFLPYVHDPITLKGWIGKAKASTSAQVTIFCHADISGFDYGNGLISKEGLNVEDTLGARIISGHYHKHQWIGNVTFLGTPFSHSFGESNQEKYIGIYDSETGDLQLIETPFPRHVSFEVDCSGTGRPAFDTSDHVRIILTGTQEEIDQFPRVDGVKYVERPIAAIKAVTIDETASPEVQFLKWAKEIKGYSDDVLELGLEVLSDV